MQNIQNIKGCSSLRMSQQKDEIARVELKSNVKSNQHRLVKIENSITWVVRVVIGALITGAIGMIYFFAKH